MKGLFITFEGADSCGKTTQLKLLQDYLHSKNYSVVTTREPGGTIIGEEIRKILLGADVTMAKQTECLLYLAVRAEHVHNIINPALKLGKVVLCDRFVDSTIVYQGIARGLDMSSIELMNSFATDNLTPDLTFLLDLPEPVLQKRWQEKLEKDRIEKEGFDFQKKIKQGFLALAQTNADRIKLVHGDRDRLIIQGEIQFYINKLLHNKEVE